MAGAPPFSHVICEAATAVPKPRLRKVGACVAEEAYRKVPDVARRVAVVAGLDDVLLPQDLLEARHRLLVLLGAADGAVLPGREHPHRHPPQVLLRRQDGRGVEWRAALRGVSWQARR